MSANHRLSAAVAALLATAPLHAQETRLEEVVVTSTALRESPLDIAQPTAVLAGDDLRRQISASLGETLATQLGVSSTYFGPAASRPVIRGLGGYRVQTLQDGLASLDVAGLSQDHAVTLEAVVSRQIEVIKGPAALLYGSGAAGGLVNVVSNRVPLERPTDDLSGAAELRGGTADDERTGAVSLDGGFGPLALHADYYTRETDDVDIPGYAQSGILRRSLQAAGEEPDGVRGSIPNTASDTEGGAFGAAYLGEAARGGVSWSRHESTYGIPGEEEAFIVMKQNRIDAKARWELPGALTALNLSGSHNDYTHTEFEAPGEPGTRFDQKAYDTRLTADHELESGWRGTTGLQYLDVDFVAIGEEAFVPSSTTRAVGLFAFEERHFTDWTLELGARVENQRIDVESAAGLPDYDGTALSVSAGTVWKWAPDRALALHVTRTQRNPQANELYANPEVPHIAARRFETGDPDLDKETAITVDLSLRSTSEEGLRWTLTAFYNDYADFIYENPTDVFLPTEEGDEFQVFEYLQRGAVLYGFEAELVLPLWEQGERHLDLRLASDYVRGKLDGGANLPQMPPLRVGAGLHFEAGPWHLGAEAFRYDAQDEVAPNELATEAYTMLDLDASYRWTAGATDLFVFAKGTNLLDEDARQHASPLKDIAPLPGRALHVGVRVEF